MQFWILTRFPIVTPKIHVNTLAELAVLADACGRHDLRLAPDLRARADHGVAGDLGGRMGEVGLVSHNFSV